MGCGLGCASLLDLKVAGTNIEKSGLNLTMAMD